MSFDSTLRKSYLLRATNFSIVLLKLPLTVSVVSVPVLNLCIANSIDESKWCFLYTDLDKTV